MLKLSYPLVLPFKLRASFRGQVVEKTMVINHWNAAGRLITYHAEKKLTEVVETAREKLVRFWDRVKGVMEQKGLNADDLDEEVRNSL